MKTIIGKDKTDMAAKAADFAAERIRKAIADRGEARVIVATGASQFEFLEALVKEPGIDWTKVTGFHLDEYVGLPVSHKASFRNYMRERFVSKTPQPMKAFNEPADFNTEDAYIVVNLDEKCRNQQVGEGWFATIDDVPKQAFSMTIKQIMWSRAICCTCPDARKADAVRGAVEGPVTNMLPSSVMQLHPDCALFLDPASASKLSCR